MNDEERMALLELTRIREAFPINDELETQSTIRHKRWWTGGFIAGFYGGIMCGLVILPSVFCLPLERKQKYTFAFGIVAGYIFFLFLIGLDYLRGGIIGKTWLQKIGLIYT